MIAHRRSPTTTPGSVRSRLTGATIKEAIVDIYGDEYIGGSNPPSPTGEEVPDPVLRRGKVWLESKIRAFRETGQVQETSDLPGWGNQEQPIGIQGFERVEQDMRPGGVHKRDRTHIEANVAGRRQQMVNLRLQQASGSQVDLP